MDKFLVIDLEMDLRSARADFEKKYLTAQINNFNGNISKTAKFIGMDRSELHRKLNDLAWWPEGSCSAACSRSAETGGFLTSRGTWWMQPLLQVPQLTLLKVHVFLSWLKNHLKQNFTLHFNMKK